MTSTLSALCDFFDDELERQENVLAVCIAQGQAARAHDLDALEAKTAALNLLLSEFVEAERERLRLVQQIVEEYELPERRQTLSDVIALAPEPWKSRMQDFQERMQKTLRETRSEVLSNDRIMRGSLTIVDEALASLVSCVPESLGNYDARGAEAQQHRLDPAMIDQRG